MKRAALLLAGALVSLSLQAQNKKIYIPEDLRKMNLQADTSQWSLKHSIETDDLIQESAGQVLDSFYQCPRRFGVSW